MQKYIKLLTVFLIVAPSLTVSIQLNKDIQKKIEENEERIRQLEAQNQENEKYLNFEDAIKSTKEYISTLKKRLNQCRKRRQCKADNEIIVSQKAQIADKTNLLEIQKNETNKAYQQLEDYKEQIRRKDLEIKQLQKTIISLESRTQNKFKSLPSSCLNLTAGVKQIQLTNGKSFNAECDGNGWMKIQQRYDGSENFVRNWTDYVNGFGNLRGEFWIGLEILHLVTNLARHQLLISIRNTKESIVAEYDNFRVGNTATFYNLESIGKYTGNLNVLGQNVNCQFVIFDKNRNLNGFPNCLEGGWWYLPNCSDYNLNAPYNQGVLRPKRNTIMMIRPNGIGH